MAGGPAERAPAAGGPAADGPPVGEEITLRVGPVAHGGHCVARHPDAPGGRVVFVRHALPGERVTARITEDCGSYLRADAFAVLDRSTDRVAAPCPHAGPGGCGGCDWQHVNAAAQRRLKAEVVREQLVRLAGVDVVVRVEELPGGLLGWRRRIGYAADPDGWLGLRRHRSHEVLPLTSCPLGVAGVGDAAALGRCWPRSAGVELVADDCGTVTLIEHRQMRPSESIGRAEPIGCVEPSRRTGDRPRSGPGARSGDRADRLRYDGPDHLRYQVSGREFTVAATGFWQGHPCAAATFAGAVLDALRPEPGERVVDLYAGAGLFTALLAEAVGTRGAVLGIEADRQAARDAVANLADLPQAAVRAGRVRARTLRELDVDPDLVVLDPPRAGAGREVMAAVLARAPRAVAYVACDPAALARDLRVALDAGWQLAGLRAFDAFPMTHHVECVALLRPGLDHRPRILAP